MMSWIFGLLLLFSIVTAFFNGRTQEVTAAVLNTDDNAVDLALTLCGSLCLWNGFMNVAQKSGLSQKLSQWLFPLVKRLFPGVSKGSAAAQAITMNLAANLLGLGNAATPFGIRAVRELAKQPRKDPSSSATDNIILFVVLNTASFQMIPTTTVLLRASANSSAPMEVAPAIWLASAVSVSCGIAAAKLFALWGRRNRLG